MAGDAPLLLIVILCVFQYFTACGRNSLSVYCLGVSAFAAACFVICIAYIFCMSLVYV